MKSRVMSSLGIVSLGLALVVTAGVYLLRLDNGPAAGGRSVKLVMR